MSKENQMESSKIRVLCVEDEQDIRENIVEILRDEGFLVFEAKNGKFAFESFLENKPDVIISDIMMPEVDGYGLLKMVRESKSVNSNIIPFIFLTALGQRDDVIKGTNLSANDYLVKPIDFDLMIAKIREKAKSYSNVQESNNRNIKNLKNQVITALPNDLSYYIDVITNVAANLKEEPYGPLPHRRYLDEIEKIYLNAVKLKCALRNSFDENTINQRLNAQEEVIMPFKFMQDLISGLSDKFKTKIELEEPFNLDELPKVKIDKNILLEGLKKIFSGMFKFDENATLTISIMKDHLNQLAIIFYANSYKKDNLKTAFDLAQISKILDAQNCRFEIVQTRENTAILIIPSYRII